MLDAYLKRHDGVITLAQARAAGLSHSAVRRRLQSGHWVRRFQGVYFADDRPYTDAARIRAAVWSYGPYGAASGLSAAWWHGLTQFAPDTVEVTIPRGSNGRRRPGCKPRRRDIPSADIVEIRGMRVTNLPLTVVEAAARYGGGAKLMDAALQRRVVELRALWRIHLQHKGRYGSPRARRLLQASDDGAQSVAERLLHALLREARIDGWKANYRVGGYRVDVGFPVQKVAIEVDGFAFHSGADEFQIDRTRQNDIVMLRWKVLRFTWLDLTEHPERVVALIRAAITA
ncbi:type IV toxin-antitoxin system AbiEi family antitoxin domain-containing protein [Mycobacterium sp. pW049]|uniref:type IV toxin-antitoxin system AbiEi family antitoxin domain-containing protein n=1 Tax=[Mycobacterium] bulgaricum TaxID=3238985 RepID=UPI00351BB33F